MVCEPSDPYKDILYLFLLYIIYGNKTKGFDIIFEGYLIEQHTLILNFDFIFWSNIVSCFITFGSDLFIWNKFGVDTGQ